MIVLIGAMGENRVIGVNGDLPWHLPEDLARFKTLTMGKPIIMGRATFESIGRPLPGRINIVLSRNPDFSVEGVEVASTPAEALEIAVRHSGKDGEVAVIGGGQVYRQFLALADRIELTVVGQHPDGDTFFPDLDSDEWSLVSETVGRGTPRLRFQTLLRHSQEPDTI